MPTPAGSETEGLTREESDVLAVVVVDFETRRAARSWSEIEPAAEHGLIEIERRDHLPGRAAQGCLSPYCAGTGTHGSGQLETFG